MASTLTAFGVSLCISLFNNDPLLVPTYKNCQWAISQYRPPTDKWGRSPISSWSCPNDNDSPQCHPADYDCHVLATYETAGKSPYPILDGPGGKEWYCTKQMTIKWTKDGLWYWSDK